MVKALPSKLAIWSSLIAVVALPVALHAENKHNHMFDLQYRSTYHQVAPTKNNAGYRQIIKPKEYQLQYHRHNNKPLSGSVEKSRVVAHQQVQRPKEVFQVKGGRKVVTPKFHLSYTPEHITPFENIVVDGDTAVIVNGSKSFSIKATSKTIYPTKLIDITIKNRTLYLSRHAKRSWSKKAQQTVFVNVSMNHIHSITLKDEARLTAYNLNTKNLRVHSSSSGGMRLQGEIQLAELIHTGIGNVDIEWINSDNLKIVTTGAGHMRLAGIANSMNLRAVDHAQVDAKYLRAKNAFVQTGDYAEVLVSAVNALSGFASDCSNILYFKTPHHLTRHTYASGNVMQMRYWN